MGAQKGHFMSNEKTNTLNKDTIPKYVSPYEHRSAAHEASAKKYRKIGDELCNSFSSLQREAYRTWEMFFDSDEQTMTSQDTDL